ncbi:MAG: DUF4430 domain-containing protein [Gaiellales bacterium]|nr:DUF4430 domain-containing protein [Gaiellales bacterium]
MKKPLLAAVLALLLLAVTVPPALAVDVTTRIQGLGWELSSPLTLTVPEQLTAVDAEGVVIECTTANPLGALYLTTLHSEDDFATTYGGAFIGSIAGIGGPAADWASWWLYAVNGCMPAVGMLDWVLDEGETLLYFEAGGDPLAPWTIKELVVEGSSATPAGQAVTFTVRGDDLGKANSPDDAPKFGLDPATQVETASQFAPVVGANLHVGDRTYQTAADGRATITDLPAGAYRVWAEKPFDDQWQYVSSSPSRVLVAEFSDVPTGNPHYQAIHRIAALGIVGGYASATGTEFRPLASLYRAQFAKMISLAVGLDVVPGASSPFWDLGERQAGNPYPHDYVAAAHRAGIVNGTGANSFGPYEDVSRAQVVTMVTRAAIQQGLTAEPPANFQSAWGNFSEVHAPLAALAQHNGLLEGLDLHGSAADPWAPMPRAEAAQVINNYLDLNDSLAE